MPVFNTSRYWQLQTASATQSNDKVEADLRINWKTTTIVCSNKPIAATRHTALWCAGQTTAYHGLVRWEAVQGGLELAEDFFLQCLRKIKFCSIKRLRHLSTHHSWFYQQTVTTLDSLWSDRAKNSQNRVPDKQLSSCGGCHQVSTGTEWHAMDVLECACNTNQRLKALG